MNALDIVVNIGTGFIGSLAAVAFWFHHDLENRWHLCKVRRGERIEDLTRMQDEVNIAIHNELLEEERKRGNL
jgi:hypothetical protein